MYRRILLATDETRESMSALREGAILAKSCGAKVFLLLILGQSEVLIVADTVHAVSNSPDGQMLLKKGLNRLRRLGVNASGAMVVGEPGQRIGAAAVQFGADLVVVGHRRQSLWRRWWSGTSGANLVDRVDCSVLVARSQVSDEEFEAMMERVELEPADR